ncbi:MAG: hypothetical protein J1E16_10870 [Muribaculaceae bacterium]|nr:hypothetical protein [Muribaculaceae bacterium]
MLTKGVENIEYNSKLTTHNLQLKTRPSPTADAAISYTIPLRYDFKRQIIIQEAPKESHEDSLWSLFLYYWKNDRYIFAVIAII